MQVTILLTYLGINLYNENEQMSFIFQQSRKTNIIVRKFNLVCIHSLLHFICNYIDVAPSLAYSLLRNEGFSLFFYNRELRGFITESDEMIGFLVYYLSGLWPLVISVQHYWKFIIKLKCPKTSPCR